MCRYFCQYSLENWGMYAQINEAYDQSVTKINTKPVLNERRVDKYWIQDLIIIYLNEKL